MVVAALGYAADEPTVDGRLYDSADSEIDGATVYLYSDDGKVVQEAGTAMTDSQGRFKFYLPKGTKGKYFLMFICADGRICYYPSTTGTFNVPEDSHNLDITCVDPIASGWSGSAPGTERLAVWFSDGRMEMTKTANGRMSVARGTYHRIGSASGTGTGQTVAAFCVDGLSGCYTMVVRTSGNRLYGYSRWLETPLNPSGIFVAESHAAPPAAK